MEHIQSGIERLIMLKLAAKVLHLWDIIVETLDEELIKVLIKKLVYNILTLELYPLVNTYTIELNLVKVDLSYTMDLEITLMLRE
jgi:hypothetical protein